MAKIVIDAGHGGDDGGASGNGITEKDLTLAISNYMYELFQNLNIPVTMTRTSDETLSPTERVDRILSPYGNSSDVIVISNHINAGGGDGAEVIYALRNSGKLANLVLDNIESTGQNVRKAYQRRLPSDTSKDYYFIHRNTGITEPIIVEYGFLDSTGDDVGQLKNNWKQMTEAVVKGVVEYIGGTYNQEVSGYYIVKSGDSLWSIAKKYNTTVDELKRLNNLTSNLLTIGQRLKVPEEEKEVDEGIYVVKSGDTLYAIAQKYGMTVDELKRLNNLASNTLSIGQKLKIKEEMQEITPTGTYIVKSGDSLYSIARKYNTTVDELKKLNNLTSDLLNIGQQLKIPNSASEEQNETTEYIVYIVKSGDNLYTLANKYNTTVSEIMNLNNLTSNLLNIGQKLKIPTSTSNVTTYTVKSGDNLYSIARKYNTTVDEIKKKNNLKSDLLSIGQVLII